MIKHLTTALLIGSAVSSLPWLLRGHGAFAFTELLLIPGLIFAVVLAGGNVHTYSLTVTFVASAGFYALLAYFYLRYHARNRTESQLASSSFASNESESF
jgi:hypothetical protein